jgi:hypothetical protein
LRWKILLRHQDKAVELFEKLAAREITVPQFISDVEDLPDEELEKIRRVLCALGIDTHPRTT